MALEKSIGNPLVSVCIQTYQHKPFIRECLDSVLEQQTSFPFEIVLGEDESTDGTRDICIEYAHKFPGIIRLFLRSRSNVIYVNNRPTGRFNFVENLKAARGKYIAIVEGDDFWTDLHKLQKQVDFLESNLDCVACHHWQEVAELGDDGKYRRKPAPKEGHGYYPTPKSDIKVIFANKLRVKVRTIMFRNVIKEFPHWFFRVAYGDVPLSMILGKFGNFGFINEQMAVYRLTGKGVSKIGHGTWLFIFNHFIEWIRIWEYGNNYYNGKYKKEAFRTINRFYTAIFKKYRYNYKVFFMAFGYILNDSQLHLFYRIQFILAISKTFMLAKITDLFKQ